MALPLETLSRDFLNRLHPSAIEDRSAVHALLIRLWRDGVELRRGVNRKISREVARIEAVERDRLRLRTENFEPVQRKQLWLNFDLDARPFFFATPILFSDGDMVEARLPEAVYRKERRDRLRTVAEQADNMWARRRVVLEVGRTTLEGEVANMSPGGLGVHVYAPVTLPPGASVALSFPDDPASSPATGRVCHVSCRADDAGSIRLGIAFSGASSLAVETISGAAEGFSWRRARQAWDFVAAGAAARSERLVRAVTRRTTQPNVAVLDLLNSKGQNIRAIANFSGGSPTSGAPLVLIPPAWGRTKETLLPLASTIVSTFEKAGHPVSVVRFDGIRKRGESHNDPDCREAGKEHHRFTFSQGVDDIHAVLDELHRNPAFRPSRVALVTFSAAAIDGRRALAIDKERRMDGWVSVVGSPDIQSMMRVVSGGLDYVGGYERGISFGIQEILGVEVDIDLAAGDAIASKLAYLDDSCSDMDEIQVPVTWIHGRHDAWMDLSRVRTMMSHGDPSKRKLIIVPTGHQLRTSREAFDVFQLVAEEVARICIGSKVRARLPSLAKLESERASERARLPLPQVDRRSFWKDYLLGRDGSLGIELMTNASSYRQFMCEQIRELGTSSGGLVADIGSGTGALLTCVADLPAPAGLVMVHELDYVREAFSRARLVIPRLPPTVQAAFIACDLAADGKALSIPCKDSIYDAAIASLFISYVNDPLAVLREIFRVIRPGGRLVVSGLRRDADVSKLFVDAIEEIARGEGVRRLPNARDLDFDIELATRNFLNDASRLLDFEEGGLFQFRDATELAGLLHNAGFNVDKMWNSFGDPPQAAVVSARKPLPS